MYRVFEALDELVTICEEARGVPMTTSCVVPRGDVLELLDDIREAIPGELDDAQDVLDHRDKLVADAADEAERATAEARTEADRLLAEAREQAQQMIAEAEHEAERVVARGRREYADLTDRAAAEADRMTEAGRQSYERAVTDGRAEQQRLVSEHEVTLAARDEAGRILDRAADDAHQARTDCDHYVETSLAEFTETLESVLDTVGRHRHQLRTGQVGAAAQEHAPERASA
ncbi:DivIVA domain-containing protein [Actinomycetospora chiangmaiensis]|uniref:DivIVA domain-containing protein n=1 Tax=Actinomycetospora chiangmaiensis TaxID=402650 RepID=UPI000365F1A4|nr:DivIVA domain-containing protein [Actinomycetospora chiangmaiensis]